MPRSHPDQEDRQGDTHSIAFPPCLYGHGVPIPPQPRSRYSKEETPPLIPTCHLPQVQQTSSKDNIACIKDRLTHIRAIFAPVYLLASNVCTYLYTLPEGAKKNLTLLQVLFFEAKGQTWLWLFFCPKSILSIYNKSDTLSSSYLRS